MELIQIPVGHMGNLSYIVYDKSGRQALIIDPSWEADKLSDAIRKNNLDLKAILLTHGHFDHSNAVPGIMREFGNIPAYMRQEDSNLPQEPFPFTTFEDGFSMPGFAAIKAICTPGHTAGSVCWLMEDYNNKILFTGDTLFAGACGRIDFPESMPHKMHGTLRQLAQMPDDMVIYPGHSYNKSISTIGEEKKHNPYLKAAAELTNDEFIEMMMY